MEALLDLLDTIRSLEEKQATTTDPRELYDNAYTLDLLKNSLAFEVDRIRRSLKNVA